MVKLYTTTPTKPLSLIRGIVLLFCITLAFQGFGQLQNIPCTGYNADVVANGTAKSNVSTNNDIDANSLSLFQTILTRLGYLQNKKCIYNDSTSLRTVGLTYTLHLSQE
jgi:hypothetical protein